MADDLITRAEADAMVAAALRMAAQSAELAPYRRGGMICGCSDGLADYTRDAILALTPADAAAALDEVRRKARKETGLRITGPNSDGEYWLHIKVGGRSGGVNLGAEHGPICKRLLDAASATGEKE